jgi:hypothetical protein
MWVWQAHVIAVVFLTFALAVAIAVTQDDEEISTRWFAALMAGLGIAFYAVQALRGNRLAVTGCAVTLAGLTSSVVFGSDLSPEYYSFSLIGAAPLLLALATWGIPKQLGEGPPGMRRDWLLLAHAAAMGAGSVAVGAVYAAARDEATYEPQTLWFLPAVFGALVAFYALALSSPFRPSQEWGAAAGLGLVASVFGVTTGLIYAFEVSAEYYAFAALGPAIVLGALAHLRQMKTVDDLLPRSWRSGAIGCGRAAAVADCLLP